MLPSPMKTLRGLGAHVYLPSDQDGGKVGWEVLAGYETVKQDVEDTVLLALKYPEAYEKIARRWCLVTERQTFPPWLP